MRKRLWQCMIVAALAVGLLPAISASALVYTQPFEAFPVAVAEGGQVQPSVQWPWMVYMDTNDCTPAITAYNLATGESRIASGALSGTSDDHANPDIEGTKVVYSADPSATTSCDIFMFDLNTGIESAICTATGGQGNPSIDGNVVVWTDGRHDGNGGGDIYMKNLTTGVESEIATTTHNDYEPVINDGWITWTDQNDDTVKLYNLASKVTTTVGESISSRVDPFVADGFVAYRSQGVDGYSIKLYEIATGKTRTLMVSSYDIRHPEIGGGWVTWHDASNGTVYGYHIQSRVTRTLVSSFIDSEGDKAFGGRTCVGSTDVSGRSIMIWQDHRNESLPGSTTLNPDGTSDCDLYGMYLTDRYGPVITVKGVEDEGEYTEGVKPVVTCDEGCAVTTKLTCNGVPVSLGTTLTKEGVYQLVATSRDSLGNPGRAEVNFVIDLDEAPAGTMQLCGGADVVNSRALTIDSVMTDAEKVTMSYSIDGGSWVDVVDAEGNDTYAAKVTVQVMDEGFHDVLVNYTDADGNVASRWDWVYVVTSPAPATLGTPKALSTVTHGKTFSVSGTFAPIHIGSGVVRVYKYKYVSGKWKSYGYTNVAITAAGNGYLGKISLPSAGKWRLRVYHKDAGHSASWSRYQKSVTAK